MDWRNANALVTGGASFIGSHLVDALIALGARVRVVDNLSSGKLDHIRPHVDAGRVEFTHADLNDPLVADQAVRGMNVVFHLAADHGGRGYVDLHQVACATNLVLDGLVFKACSKASVDKVVYASSGCVYPNHLQTDPGQVLYLTENMTRWSGTAWKGTRFGATRRSGVAASARKYGLAWRFGESRRN